MTLLMAGLNSEIRPSLSSHGHGGARAQPSSGDSTVPGFESNPIQSGDSTDPGFESNPILISNTERGQFSISRDPNVATDTGPSTVPSIIPHLHPLGTNPASPSRGFIHPCWQDIQLSIPSIEIIQLSNQSCELSNIPSISRNPPGCLMPPIHPDPEMLFQSSSITCQMSVPNKRNKIENGNRKDPGIKIISWNKGSAHLKNRIDIIRQLIQDESPHILAIQEAELQRDTNLDTVAIPEYNLYTDGLYGAGGNSWTCVYIHRDLTVSLRPDLMDPSLSLIAMTVGRPRQRKFNFIAFYRQWTNQDPDHTKRVESNLIHSQATRFGLITDIWARSIGERETITASDTNLSSELLLDDHPVPQRDAGHRPIASHFHTKILPAGVTILNRDHTHFSPIYPPATLDHITSTHPTLLYDVTTVTHGASDHKYLRCIRKSKAAIIKQRYRMCRDYKSIDPMEMNAMIWQSDSIKDSVTNTDVNMAASHFINGLTNILDCLAPLRRIQLKTDPIPFISTKTRNIQTQRDHALDTARQTNNPEEWREYRALRNQATQSMRNDNFKHMQNKINSGNSSKLWQSVKQLAGQTLKGPPNQIFINGSVITSPKEIATQMNQFFINKISRIRESIPFINTDPLEGLRRMIQGKTLPPPLQLQPVSRYQLRKIIKSMRPTKSTGVDGISMKIIKDYLPALEPAIQNIVNQSILNNTFPSILKTSKVIPIQKPKTPPGDPSSYRPINILPALSKVIEKVVFHQITEYIHKAKIITHHHHGSSPGHSPVTALLSVYQQMIENAENGQMSALIALDQSAAYDLVDHPLLIQKMKMMGMGPQTLSWIHSFLSNRFQRTEIESFLSPTIPHPPCSIIQGSIGSCILYQLFVVDLPQSLHPHPPHTHQGEPKCEGGEATTYVDDVTAMVAADTPNKLASLAQLALDRLTNYLTANKLKANKDKTQLMAVPNSTNPKPIIILQADDEIIKSVNTIKQLGVNLSQDLSWHKYISILHGELTQRIITLRTVARYASTNLLIQISNGLIMGKINYALALYSGAPVYLQQKIQSIMLTAARISNGTKSNRWSTQKLLDSMNWIGFTQQSEYVSSQLYHQILSNQSPSYLYSILYSPLTTNTRAATGGNMKLPSWRKIKSKMSFGYRATKLYNLLPPQFKSADKSQKNIFKKKLKNVIKNQRSYFTKSPLSIGDTLKHDGPLSAVACVPLKPPAPSHPTVASLPEAPSRVPGPSHTTAASHPQADSHSGSTQIQDPPRVGE